MIAPWASSFPPARVGVASLASLLVLAVVLVGPTAQAAERPAPSRPTSWSQEDVDTFARIPIQDDGRVKPLLTFARFTLLTMSGRSSVRYDVGGETVTRGPVEWLLDVLLTPDVAKAQPVFLVEDSQVLQTIGLTGKVQKKRDRYSWLDIKSARSAAHGEGSVP